MRLPLMDIAEWYSRAFWKASGRYPEVAPVALKLVEEAVEVALAAGCTPDQVKSVAAREVDKKVAKGYTQGIGAIREELADVLITGSALCAPAGIEFWQLENAVDDKMEVNETREWQVNEDGALSHVKRDGGSEQAAS